MPGQPDRRAALLSDFFALCQEELLATRGESARKYLVEQRGLPAEAIGESSLGVVSTRARSTHELHPWQGTDESQRHGGRTIRLAPSDAQVHHATARDPTGAAISPVRRPPTAQR
jgi:hypothetical protein